MSKEDAPRGSRRKVLKTVGVLGGTTTIGSAAASATSSSDGERASTDNSTTREIEKADSGEAYETFKITIEDDRSTRRFLTLSHVGGDREGKIEYVRVPEASADVSGQQATSMVQSEGNLIVERNKDLGGRLGEECKYNYCSNRKYEHVYGGFCFELTDPADTVGKDALSAAILTMVKQLSRLDPRVWAISTAVSVILSAFGGDTYTLMPIDADGFFGEERKECVAAKWNAGPDEVQQYIFQTGHINGLLDPRCET